MAAEQSTTTTPWRVMGVTIDLAARLAGMDPQGRRRSDAPASKSTASTRTPAHRAER